MKKQETFRRLLAGEYDDARYVSLKDDKELLLEMRRIGWWAYSRPLYKDNLGSGHRLNHTEGSNEWKQDIRLALTNLGRV